MKSGLTLFYADDDLEDLDIFREVVDGIGDIRLHAVDCGDKLLDLLYNPPPNPHIVFLDLNMPGKTGFSVLQEVRTSQRFDHVPIVIFSTSSDRDDVERTRKLGANYYVPKQTSYEEFKKSIEYTLSINWAQFRPDAANFFYRN